MSFLPSCPRFKSDCLQKVQPQNSLSLSELADASELNEGSKKNSLNVRILLYPRNVGLRHVQDFCPTSQMVFLNEAEVSANFASPLSIDGGNERHD